MLKRVSVSVRHISSSCVSPSMEGPALAQVNTLWVLVCCPRVSIPAPATLVHFQFNTLNTQHIPWFGFLHQIYKSDPFCILYSLSELMGMIPLLCSGGNEGDCPPCSPKGSCGHRLVALVRVIELIPVLWCWAEVMGQVCSLPAQ